MVALRPSVLLLFFLVGTHACSGPARRTVEPGEGGSGGGGGAGSSGDAGDAGREDSSGIVFVADASGPVVGDCTDQDRDGYGVGPDCRGEDLDDDDGRVYPGAPERCDGVDNDGKGGVDADDRAFDPDPCALTWGVCRGTHAECVGGESQPCEVAVYGADYEDNEDRRCDRRDNDCDGEVDEGCDCVDGDLEVCPADACADRQCADGRWLPCIRNRTPEPEECDGLDNDCDGDIDEPDDPIRPPLCGRCPFEMMLVDTNNLDVCIDRWEASRPDADANQPGMIEDGAARSRPGVKPWVALNRTSALSACRAADKDLCGLGQWQRACIYLGYLELNDNWNYPYGESYSAGRCNGAAAGEGHALPTGSLPECIVEAPRPAYDLSGNVREWAGRQNERIEGKRVAFGGSYTSAAGDLTCEAPALLSGSTEDLETGFRCCKSLDNY